MTRFPRLLAALLFIATPAAAHEADELDPLRWAVELTPEQYDGLDDAHLAKASEWLWNWAYLGPDASVPGSPEVRTQGFVKAKELAELALKRNPRDPAAYARLGLINYDLGELLDAKATEQRLAVYDEIIRLSNKCIEIDPKAADCYHWLAAGKGRLSTTKGILNSLFTAKEVEKAWLKVLELEPTTVLLNTDPTMTNAAYGLGVFYRMVPDSWFIKMVAGVRGDKEKAVKMLRGAAATQPYRLELQKELGIALICRGTADDEPEALAEGKRLLTAVVAGEYDKKDIRLTDDIDKRHSQEVLNSPKLACAYSRDGYQDLDESKVKKK